MSLAGRHSVRSLFSEHFQWFVSTLSFLRTLFANFAHDFLEWYKSAMVFWAVEVSFTIQNAIMVSNGGVQFQSSEQQVRLRLFIQVSDVPDVTCSVTLSNDMVIQLNL